MPAVIPEFDEPLYNLTNISNSGNILDFEQHINSELTGGLFGFFVLLSFLIVLFVAYKHERISLRFAAASFLTTILSFLFRIISLRNDLVVFVFVVITAISIVIAKYSE